MKLAQILRHACSLALGAFIINQPHLKAGTIFWDDFQDGNASDGRPVQWTPISGSVPGTFEASRGDYVLTPTSPHEGNFMSSAARDFILTNTSIRVQGRVSGLNDWLAVSARNQSELDKQHYFGGIGYFPNDGGTLIFLGRNSPNSHYFGELVALPFDVREEDAILQLDVIGDRLSLTAWGPGEPMPEQPQVSAWDNTFQSGWIRVGGGSEGTTTVRYVHVSDTALGPGTPPNLTPDTYAGLTIHGDAGTVYLIEYVVDLALTNTPSAWQPLEVLLLPSSPYLWIDQSVPARGQRFYRAQVLSAPSEPELLQD